MENYILNNGIAIPKIVFGCYTPNPEGFEKNLITAMEAGFTYFDTASIYKTERVLARAIKKSGIDRKKLQIASKAWTDEMGYKEIKEACYRSLERIDTDYLDVFMIHWPKKTIDQENWRELCVESWIGMEELYDEGVVKTLGMSNFLPHHLNVILEKCRIKPGIDQIEVHPGYSQEAAVSFCKDKGILVQAHSSLGSGLMINNPVVGKLTGKYGKTIPQICLRFLIQKGICPVTKSRSRGHMDSNLDIFNFDLSDEDMWMLSCMPQDYNVDGHPDFNDNDVESDLNQ